MANPVEIHDLTQPFYEDGPRMAGMPPPTITLLEGRRAHIQEITTLTHIGTHVDAPLHVVDGGTPIDELALDRLVGPGVVMDVRKEAVGPITVGDLERAAADVRPGDRVLLCTGWATLYGTPDYDPHPYLSEEAANWLVDHGVQLIAIDTLTPDLPGPLRPKTGYVGVVHRALLGRGVLILENLGDASHLIGHRLWITAAPVKVRGGDGSAVRVTAILTDVLRAALDVT